MPSPGRNEPCPCGSGKKFKRCCGSAGPAPGITRDDRNTAMAALLRFSRREEFARATASTAIAWAVEDFGDDAHTALASFLDFEPATSAYFEWLFFDARSTTAVRSRSAFWPAPPAISVRAWSTTSA